MDKTNDVARFVGVKTIDGVKTITTYGYARNAKGKIEQVYSVVQNQRTTSQTWTGVIYKNERAAAADSWRLNSAAVMEA